LLTHVQLGGMPIAECEKCDGIWVDNISFNEVCVDRQKRASLLGVASEIPETTLPVKIRYVKCPICRQLMHRNNFANCSGVIIDTCKNHGTWFDAQELHRIMAFIEGGGMDRAREKQKRDLEEARRRAEPRAPITPERDYETVRAGSDGFGVVMALMEALFSLWIRRR
jgi:Zn-finger nucleic acid-binding protein